MQVQRKSSVFFWLSYPSLHEMFRCWLRSFWANPSIIFFSTTFFFDHALSYWYRPYNVFPRDIIICIIVRIQASFNCTISLKEIISKRFSCKLCYCLCILLPLYFTAFPLNCLCTLLPLQLQNTQRRRKQFEAAGAAVQKGHIFYNKRTTNQ